MMETSSSVSKTSASRSERSKREMRVERHCVYVDVSRKQGQYIAFIHAYARLHRRAPAESEIQTYFRTTPPSVHEMLKTLQRKRFISRTAGVARSTRVLLPDHEIPELE